MDRVYESNQAATPPAAPNPPVLGYPSEANPATVPGAWWFNMMTEEIRAAIVAAGLVPDGTKTDQLALALVVTGTFTASLGGFAVDIKYRLVANCLVTLTIPPISSNSITALGSVNLTGIPAALMPATAKSVPASARWIDGSTVVSAAVSAVMNQAVSADVIQFYRTDVANWAACKGPEDGLSLTYSLD